VSPEFPVFDRTVLKGAGMSRRECVNEEYSLGISRDDLAHADKRTQIKCMRMWFFQHYDNSEEVCPYDSEEDDHSEEDGRWYFGGGPYDAFEVIDSEFGKTVPKDVITELAEELNRTTCYWSEKAHYDDDYDEDYSDAVVSNADFYKTFNKGIDEVVPSVVEG
jgi:hypothetical protein